MKRAFTLLALVLIVAVAAFGQAQPNGPSSGTVQGSKSLMIGGPHDFGPGGIHAPAQGQSKGVCDYCHRPHIMGADGQAAPLWARKSVNSALTYGVYTSVSMDANVGNGHQAPINSDDNYSAMCLSCHDGSQFLASTAWGSNGHPYNGFPNTWPFDGAPNSIDSAFAFADAGGLNPGGNMQLSHTHPVHIDYDYAQANDGQLYAKAAAGYVYLETSPATKAIGRLFNGKMECSSCHNPHFKTGIGLQSPNSANDQGGALCVSCHKK